MNTYVNDFLVKFFEPTKHIILKKNHSSIDSKRGEKAFDHFLCSVTNAIAYTINYTENQNFYVNKPTDYLKFAAEARKVFFNEYFSYNKHINTISKDSYKNIKTKGDESKPFAFAKDTYNKITNSVLSLKDLNDDALLAYQMYNITTRMVYNVCTIDENNHYVRVNEESDFVKNYRDYMNRSDTNIDENNTIFATPDNTDTTSDKTDTTPTNN